MSEITTQHQQEALVARLEVDPAWWRTRYAAAMSRIQAPGKADEVAISDSGEAAIQPDVPDVVSVFVSVSVSVSVSDWEEAVEYTPNGARRLAFDLLVLADLVEHTPTGEEGER